MQKIAIVGAGPGGLVAARYLSKWGFDPVLFEQGDRIGGQWTGNARYSGVWPSMRTNTSRVMTCFSVRGNASGKEHMMNTAGQRMLDGSRKPNATTVAEWVGSRNFKRWTHILRFIDVNYPGVFAPDWLYGGKKYGWGLRFKKSKSFCTLIPERNRLKIQIVFGGEERKKVEAILPELISHARQDYSMATTYHDGKWLGLVVDSKEALVDVEQLLKIKRKPKPAQGFKP